MQSIDPEPEQIFFRVNMGEVHRPHILVVEILDGEVGQHPSISKAMSCDVDFPPARLEVHIVLAPLLLPFLRLEGHRERPCHLDGNARWQIGSSLVVEEPEDLGLRVDGCAGELLAVDFIQLCHCQAHFPLIFRLGHQPFQLLLAEFQRSVLVFLFCLSMKSRKESYSH